MSSPSEDGWLTLMIFKILNSKNANLRVQNSKRQKKTQKTFEFFFLYFSLYF